MNERFSFGEKSMTVGELRAVWARMHPGVAYPNRVDPKALADRLAKSHWLRFEFEVNRLRGYAFDNGETGEGMLQ